MRLLQILSTTTLLVSLCCFTGCLKKERSSPEDSTPIQIEIWYGDQQSFGHLGGHTQRWINLLGNASPANSIKSLQYSLNDKSPRTLSFLEDQHRLARPGDFNVEIARTQLNPGNNRVAITATNKGGQTFEQIVTVNYVAQDGRWPLPYTIDWSKVDQLAEAAEVIDGKWKLTPKGARTVERYYDRVLAFGDESWKNYEVATTVTFHDFTPPKTGPNITNVTHAAIATRWPGHEADGKQPSRKWHPVGATAEFRIGHDLSECRWRIFDGKREFHVESDRRRSIELEKTYGMKHRVETLIDGRSRYRVKLWPDDEPEPEKWDFERFEPGDLQSGSALLIAHHTDVTFGNVRVVPVDPEAP